jgi:hypothetical protein
VEVVSTNLYSWLAMGLHHCSYCCLKRDLPYFLRIKGKTKKSKWCLVGKLG